MEEPKVPPVAGDENLSPADCNEELLFVMSVIVTEVFRRYGVMAEISKCVRNQGLDIMIEVETGHPSR